MMGRPPVLGALEQADLVEHFGELVVFGVGVLGVDDPDDALAVVGEDQVEVDAGAGRDPALGEEVQLSCGDEVRKRVARTRSQAMPAAALRAAAVGFSGLRWRSSVSRANCSSSGWMLP